MFKSYPEIGVANYGCALLIFTQKLALKMRARWHFYCSIFVLFLSGHVSKTENNQNDVHTFLFENCKVKIALIFVMLFICVFKIYVWMYVPQKLGREITFRTRNSEESISTNTDEGIDVDVDASGSVVTR